jgi:hypothetical protein
MPQFELTSRNRVRRVSEWARYERAEIYAIIDAACICHVGFEREGQPFVIPTIHAREGDGILLHGSHASRLIKHIQGGNEVCVAITLLDGLVLARSVFHHAMNYRSVTLFGRGSSIEGDDEKLQALKILSDHLIPGRWEDARQPTQKELDATAVVRIPIDTASAKVCTGPPEDDEDDYCLSVWAGVLPLKQGFLDPVADPRLDHGIALPQYLLQMSPELQAAQERSTRR